MRAELDAAVAGVAERVDAEGDQPGRNDREQEWSVLGVGDLGQGAVGADRIVRVEVYGGFDQEDAD